MHATLPLMRHYGFPGLHRSRLETLQVNLGYKCNQSCLHCHVNAGPTRTEMMSAEVLADVLALVKISSIRTLDITGGAPELHPQFRELVLRARELGVHVIDRCNLSILFEPGQEDLALLHRGAGRPAARQGRVRQKHPGAAQAERAGLRRTRQRPRT
jgi:MoaA/NifB/PqqE/SkfB family radical SAM enzyme